MIEALMLVLLGVLIMALASLALAPILWARAARVTTERLHNDVHSAAFNEASEHVSRRYEGELAQREGALRTEIEQLEASRAKISTEASSRVSTLEEERARLEQENVDLKQTVADQDARLVESEQVLATLTEGLRGLGDRAQALVSDATEISDRAGSLGTELAELSSSHQDVAASLAAPAAATYDEPAVAPETVAYEEPQAAESAPEADNLPPEPVAAVAELPPQEDGLVGSAGDEAALPDDTVAEAEPETQPEPESPAGQPEMSLSDRIRALREGVSA